MPNLRNAVFPGPDSRRCIFPAPTRLTAALWRGGGDFHTPPRSPAPEGRFQANRLLEIEPRFSKA